MPRFLGQDNQFVSSLVLLNLTGGSQFTAIVNFLGYNDNEEVFSAQESFVCWEKRRLTQISGSFDQVFLAQTNNASNEILGANSRERRSTQTAMYVMCDGLARLLAPILPVTADDLWRHMPGQRSGSTEPAKRPPRPQPISTPCLVSPIRQASPCLRL